jgi:ubiquinone/menaquinone biosynthesis C-methylase UbiE
MNRRIYIHGTDPSEQKRLILLNRLTNPAFVSFLEIPDKSRLLEVGAGTGILAIQLASMHTDSTIYTIEISYDQINNLQQKLDNLFFFQGDAHHLPFQDNSFDMIYCRYLLEHVRQPVCVLNEIYRLLKPGRKFFIQENNILIHVFYPTCPYFEYVWQQFAQLQKRLGGDAEIGKRLYVLLKHAGFRNIQLSIQPEIHAAGTAGFSDWVENIIGNIRSGEQMLFEKGLIEKRMINLAIKELHSLLQREDSAAYFYWNRAAAVK